MQRRKFLQSAGTAFTAGTYWGLYTANGRTDALISSGRRAAKWWIDFCGPGAVIGESHWRASTAPLTPEPEPAR